jgi:hypothetical protein
MSRHRRVFLACDQDQLLQAVGVFRGAVTAALARAPVGGDLYRSLSALRRAIDDFVEAVTGNRELFWSQTAGTGRFHGE